MRAQAIVGGMAADSFGVSLRPPTARGHRGRRWAQGCFHHEALLHKGGADGFASYAVPLVEQALEEEAPVLVAVSAERIGRLREALGSSAGLVAFADMLDLGTNPARIIPAWKAFLARHTTKGLALGIGEPVWPGRTTAELDECSRHEGLLNLAFRGGRPWRLICPYDLDALSDEAIGLARRNHPFLTESGAGGANADYPTEQSPGWPFEGGLPVPAQLPRTFAFAEESLRELRHFVSLWASDEKLDAGRAEDLVLAVNEIATNSVRHGGGSGTLRAWREQEVLLCEVEDRGHIQDPMLGRVEPNGDAITSRGLWIANQLCDLVRIRSSPTGSLVRLHKRI